MNNERKGVSKELALEGIHDTFDPFLEVNIKVEFDEFNGEEQKEVEIDKLEPFAEVNVKNECIADEEEEDNIVETETCEPFEEINVKTDCVSDEDENKVVQGQKMLDPLGDPLVTHTHKSIKRDRDKNSEKVIFECDICRKTFGLLFLLVAHKRIHSAPETTLNAGDIHLKNPLDSHLSIHVDRIHICNVCNKMFTEFSALKEHQLTHTGEKLFVCGMCSCWFTKLVSLHVHMRTHNSVKLNERSAKSVSSANSNQLTEINLECSVCKKKFEQRSELLVHRNLHYKCKYCHQLFEWKYLLNSHIRTHSERKLFECDVCLRKFSDSSRLSRHYIKFHVNDRIFGERQWL